MDMRVAAYAVITDPAGRVLLAHWNEHSASAWTMPGGGLDPGEDPAAAAKREVREETGYDVEVRELIGIDSQVIPAGRRVTRSAEVPLHALRIVYRAEITGGDLRNEVGGSTDEAAWFSLAEITASHEFASSDASLRFAGLLPPRDA